MPKGAAGKRKSTVNTGPHRPTRKPAVPAGIATTNDESLGWTAAEVRPMLERAGLTWRQFQSWIKGQTVAIDSKGKVRYYRSDVTRFLMMGPETPVYD